MAAPTTRIISLTITEGGYNTVRETGEFDVDEPGVRADLEDPSHPRTVFGLVTEALRRRRARGVAAPTVMSCDNIEANGEIARRVFTTHARLVDAELGAWVESEVAFPSSMVDRITPVTPAAASGEIAEQFGVEDAWPVVAEPFTQWVLEDHFADGRPSFEDAGVQLVDDVTPYELMKLRLLNASHQGIAYFAHLCGYTLVHEAAQDPLFERFLLAYMEREATPTLRPVPGVDLDDYRHTLIERFANPRIGDTVARLAAESSDRIPTWLVPVIRENLRAGRDVTLSAAIVASWARYAEGTDESGEPIEVVDRLKDTLVPIAQRQREDPTAFVANRDVFGDLIDHEAFVGPYLAALESLQDHGARATLQSLVDALD
jgi:mannitol 2-dehydrogenase